MCGSKLLLLGVVLLLISCATPHADKKETILAIFAHPDDETIAAPVLAKYAVAGHDVYLVIHKYFQIGIDFYKDLPIISPQKSALLHPAYQISSSSL